MHISDVLQVDGQTRDGTNIKESHYDCMAWITQHIVTRTIVQVADSCHMPSSVAIGVCRHL